jgi:hypothetical protein
VRVGLPPVSHSLSDRIEPNDGGNICLNGLCLYAVRQRVLCGHLTTSGTVRTDLGETEDLGEFEPTEADGVGRDVVLELNWSCRPVVG